MGYSYVEPEVAGGLGESTRRDTRSHPPRVSRLHYQFDGWLGDALLESFPSFIITEAGSRTLAAEGLSGASFDEVKITKSEMFEQVQPSLELPDFLWLKPNGRPGQDDFGTAQDGRLVVSDKALAALQRLGIPNALVEPFDASS